jgi:hypothetical protein
MKSDTEFDGSSVRTPILTRINNEKLVRNPITSHLRRSPTENVDKAILSSRTMELVQLAIRDRVRQNSRIMAWDSQRIFGPASDDRPSAEHVDLEAE